jgi:Trk K+ transport system NAD-binding subunit
VRGYRRAVWADANRLDRVATNAGIYEHRVADAAPAVDRPVLDADLPDGTIVVSLQRGDTVHYDVPALRLRPGDVLTLLARPEAVPAIATALGPAVGRAPA